MCNLRISYLSFILITIFSGCKKDPAAHESTSMADSNNLVKQRSLFTLVQPSISGINFVNTLEEGPNTNILVYEYFYNGGGVATGDLNNDGLIDIYFSSNMGKNKVYLNMGNFKFQDITVSSGAEGREGPWKTGVTMADVNGDGKLDIYLCYSGMLPDEKRKNQLFINTTIDEKGIPHFTEKANEYGLASEAYSNQSYFFDYDRDGDLDMLLLNHNPNSLPVLNEVSTAELLKKDDPLKGVRLYKQTKGRFEDVTPRSGISSSALTYGLGIGISDINNDGWPDFYISNDYTIPDYLYINNKNGTFTDQLQQSVGHNSQFSMGNDVADINNDGLNDIITLDMLPEDNHRQKLLLAPDNYGKFDLNVRSGFYYQYMRNMLQLNNGDGTFSEIGQLSGVSNTDWSWAALLADYNNDGWKDLFITNGYHRDYTNMDFIKYMDDYVKLKGRLKREDVLELITHMPASNVVNYIFSNSGGLNFQNETKNWGMDRPSNSNGAAYADLDNDGDLDIVVNNVNQPAFIYRNGSDKMSANHFLQVRLSGEGLNTMGLGSKVSIRYKGKRQDLEQISSRGYLSSVSPVLQFGLGDNTVVDSVIVTWSRGKQQVVTNPQIDQELTLSEKDAKGNFQPARSSKRLFKEVASPFSHQNPIVKVNDFKRQPLLVNPMSFSGPCMAKGDINGDGLEDLYIGGGSGQAAALFIQSKGGSFKQQPVSAFEGDKMAEDAAAVFIDANKDGYNDLYVASGGYHSYDKSDALLQDRLYINDGKGGLTKITDALPQMRVSKGCVSVNDVNGDGFPDLFVGGRVIPGRYPETPSSYLLINDGKGKFTDEIASIAPELQHAGMITDSKWIDINGDNKDDLVVVGEWMPISMFVSTGGKLENQTKKFFDKEYSGWWNKIETGDFNKDGKPDLIAGNMGLNTPCKVSDDEPGEMYFKDFDNNGSVDPFFCFYIQGKSYPYVTRDELLEQIGSLRSRFRDYKSYADIALKDIFKPEDLSAAGHLTINRLETTLLLSTPSGKFKVAELPQEVQYSPIYTITIFDYDKDGNDDILLCGNANKAKLRLGKFDANYGALIKGQGDGRFTYISQKISGFSLKGDVRSVVMLNNDLVFGIGQSATKAYRQN